MTPSQFTDEQLQEFLASAIQTAAEDRKQNQLLFYLPNSEKTRRLHESKAKVIAAGGGNRSGKTESMLVEMAMCSTGVFPYAMQHLVKQKFRGPINCRLTVESLTTTLEPTILPKLQWWRWNGVDAPGGARGHWGWIPKNCLIDGDWQRSYNTKTRILRMLCRDPENPDHVLGESSWQFMSFDQDPSDFASGEFHICGHDEPPSGAIWHENEARVMSVGGRLLLAMTWPDDPSINVDWLYNEVYEPARHGNPDIEWLELWTTDNKNIDQDAVAAQAGKWSNEVAGVRIYGRPIRFSNRVHPEFTDQTRHWCLKCSKAMIPVKLEHKDGSGCPECGCENMPEFNHVEEFETAHNWPTVFLLDPHPRKPHMYMWVQISPADDWYVLADGKMEGDCVQVRKDAENTEIELGINVAQRLMDPNMGASVAGQDRNMTWQNEFANAGLRCDLANDVDIGRSRINTMLRVDDRTLRPRLHIHPRCRDTIYQLQRYTWAEFSKNVDRDMKQTPKDTNDDYPTLLKYLANSDPNFRFLRQPPPIIKRQSRRVSA